MNTSIPSPIDYEPPASVSAPDTHVEEEPTPAEKWWVRRLRLSIFLFLLYVTSVGPMFWVWHENMYLDGNPYIAMFYLPLAYLAEWFPWFGELLNLYVMWWLTW
jgi:hypothetical protein